MPIDAKRTTSKNGDIDLVGATAARVKLPSSTTQLLGSEAIHSDYCCLLLNLHGNKLVFIPYK